MKVLLVLAVALFPCAGSAQTTYVPSGHVFSLSDVSGHASGGTFSNFSGTTVFPFESRATSSFLEPPSLFPPSGGLSIAEGRALAFLGPTAPNTLNLLGVPIVFNSPNEVISFSQVANAARNGTAESVSNSASYTSLYDFTVPDLGAGVSLLWNYIFTINVSLPNGGTGLASGSAKLTNLSSGQVLFSSTTSQAGGLRLNLAPGTVLRMELDADVSGTFPVESSDLGSARASFSNRFGAITIPEPSSAVLLGLVAFFLSARRNRR